MKCILLALASLPVTNLFAVPSISSVTAQQRYPWNGKVDISYKVSGDVAAHCMEYGIIPSLKVTATDKIANKTYTATKLNGDMSLTEGTHQLVWDMDAQGLLIQSGRVVFNVLCETVEATYCVIDLSGGETAPNYPVAHLETEPSGGFNINAYKTSKLVLKRIKAGSFIMGTSQTDQSHKVTLTKPFYMGLFEVTQKQWTLVMGANPARTCGVGDEYPIYYVSYNMIRGGSKGMAWPSSSTVDTMSFVGKIQAKTGLKFDLSTAAQWEYACRAGTTTKYSYGDMADGAYMWYFENASSTKPVGSRKPNAWGLYDMHGNVWEWNLDWSGELEYGTDPKGTFTGSNRVNSGGCWCNGASDCASSKREGNAPSFAGYDLGFRLARTLP